MLMMMWEKVYRKKKEVFVFDVIIFLWYKICFEFIYNLFLIDKFLYKKNMFNFLCFMMLLFILISILMDFVYFK